MKFAIIAAGEGSRLLQEGIECPKPLVNVCGIPMIDRLIRIFEDSGATEVLVIVSEQGLSVKEHLERLVLSVPLRVIVQSTPSSMHSLYVLSPYLGDAPFCLTTVDTIFKADEFKEYIRRFEASDVDALMAVTPFVDDESPLYVAVGNANAITGFHDVKEWEDVFVSGGIYCLRPSALAVLAKCIRGGMSRMRNFQRQLVAEGLRLEAFPFGKIVDVDHREDIRKAEDFLNEGCMGVGRQKEHPIRVVGVSRGDKYSPNLVNSDAAIIRRVAERLSARGCIVMVYTEIDFVDMEIRADYIFDMARDERTILRLQQLEQQGALVLNSGYGIANCIRLPMTEILMANGIPHPRSWILRPDTPLPDDMTYPCWVKRGDSCALQKEDVSYVQTKEEAETVLRLFWERGIDVAVINEHLRGDLIKFYGVQDTDFFHWFYPSSTSHTKFGLEAINGEAKGLPFSAMQLKQYADKAARALGVPIYGGDCIVMENEDMKIFDFNDWPSFSPCMGHKTKRINWDEA